MHAPVDHMKEFKGVLVSRKYRPGHSYIQLLFQTADDLQLCLSRNVQMVRELQLGQTYQVSGHKYTVGQVEYVRDPVPTLVQPGSGKRRLWFASGAVCLVLLLGVGGLIAMQSKGSAPAKQPKRKAPAASPQTLSEQTEGSLPSSTTSGDSTEQPTPETTPAPVPRSARSTPASTSPAPTPPAPQPVTPQSPPPATPPPPPPPPEETPPEEPPTEPPAEPPAEPTP
jgi:hypothetical protein